MTRPLISSGQSGVLLRKCACGHMAIGGEYTQCNKNNQLLRRSISSSPESESHGRGVPPIVYDVLRSPGQPLDPATRAFFEPRFGHDFSKVRVHTDSKAAESAKAVNASAYTVGSDVVFGNRQSASGIRTDQELLAHELTHVAQKEGKESNDSIFIGSVYDPCENEAEQVAEAVLHGQSIRPSAITLDGPILQRQAAEVIAGAKPKINYKRAKKFNIDNASRNNLGWEGKLDTVAGAAYKAWADFWARKEYNAFADAVAEFQEKQGWPARSIDGVLGIKTWSIIGGLGEAIAGIRSVNWEKSESVCTMATKERIHRGHQLAAGKGLELGKEEQNAFNIILQSVPDRMMDVEEQYRGAGAAGAMVYAGMGTFVPEADIWAGKLTPGAVIQGWWNRADYDLLRAGEITEGKEKRPLQLTDISIIAGSSMVFVRYDTETNERILVRHYGRTEWKTKTSFAVWVAANVNLPTQLPDQE